MRFILLIFLEILLIHGISFGQISQGGKPIKISVLKSAGIPVVKMPVLNNKVLKAKAMEAFSDKANLKPFRFAKSFDVNLSPKNSGEWITETDGTKIWRIKIKSEGAKSLNLIFDRFFLPQGARVFLYNEKEDYYLGAFTSFNNKPSGKFAVSPVMGDEITIQYELPPNYTPDEDFVIIQVNHDYVGILKYGDRRPLDKLAGSCNIDVNCDMGDGWDDVKDAVCRLIVNGVEICSGTLINNTAEDQKPYVISAAHCYDMWDYAETTVYAFNYESPYCAPLDGDPAHSISGAVLKAQFDSLDFALAELSLVPPPDFRPYFAGWDRSGEVPDSTATIHHPQGDIKKISFDDDSPEFDDFNSNYIPNAFIKVLRWDAGVTEAGSSGGALFNTDKNVIGTLTGGLATCSNPVKDYFERFELSWDYKSDPTKQLKYWLDPENSGATSLNGKRFYTGEEYCMAITNLTDDDEHATIPLTVSGQFRGYWGGTNNLGIKEFAERFNVPGNEQLDGISLGIGKIVRETGSTAQIKVKVYEGNLLPENVIYSQTLNIRNLVADAMNFIGFSETVEPVDDFFVGFELTNMQPTDTFVIYQSLRSKEKENFFYYKSGNQWFDYKVENNGQNSIANVFELVACNVDSEVEPQDTFLVDDPLGILVYPNPANSFITLEAGQDILLEKIGVYNLLGKAVDAKFDKTKSRKVRIDLSGNVPGIYFIRFDNGINFVTKKVSFVPW